MLLARPDERLRRNLLQIQVFHRQSVDAVLPRGRVDQVGSYHRIEIHAVHIHAVTAQNEHVVLDILTALANPRIL